MTQNPWADTVARFSEACADFGLDLVHAFTTGDYNPHVAAEHRLSDFGRARALALLVGNTRALWSPFRAAWATDPWLCAATDPLDRYVAERIARAISAATLAATHTRFAHVTVPQALPIARLAELAGFASLAPSHLAIHPQHGPWLALRAVVVFDIEGPEEAPPRLASPCHECAAPCVPALSRALQVSGPRLDASRVAQHAGEWIAVRDACPVGRASRYGDAQLDYHYGLGRKVQGS